jgi:hypothetical protein
LEIGLPILSSISVQLHSRFDAIQKHFNLFRADTIKDSNGLAQRSQVVPTALQFEATVSDRPIVPTRASLYIYMNAAVSHSELIDAASRTYLV